MSAENFITALDLITSIPRLIYSLFDMFHNKIKKWILESRDIRRVLGVNKKEEFVVTLPVFDIETYYSKQFVTFNSVYASQLIFQMLNKVDQKVLPIKNGSENVSTIHIGGPIGNIHVNALFSEEKYNFKFITPKSDELNTKMLNRNDSFIEYSENGDRCFVIGNSHLKLESGKKDYGIIIKIPPSINCRTDHVTHIIFGCWSNGTLKAVEYFTTNYKTISKKYKSSKYCAAIPINLIDNTYRTSINDIIDLTSEFFK